MTDSPAFLAFYAGVLIVPVFVYLRRQSKKEVRALEAAEKGQLFSEGPRGQHPHIDVTNCIGCQSCTSVCPEGEVLRRIF